VDVRVLAVDADQRRISLSLKVGGDAEPAAAGEATHAEEADPGRARKERKRPLRGGLSW